MIIVWRFADVATCRAVSNPAWCRIFRDSEYHVFPLSILGQILLRCHWARHFTLKCFKCAGMAAGLYALRRHEIAHE